MSYGPNICTGGTASALAYYSSYTADKAFDGNDSTVWYMNSAADNWIKYDLGAGVTKIAAQYTVLGSITSLYSMRSWVFAGSNDNVNWTTIDTQTGQTFAQGETKTYNSFSNTTAYRYYRWYITEGNTNDHPQAAELEIMELTGDQTVVIPVAALVLTAYPPSAGVKYQVSNEAQLVLAALNPSPIIDLTVHPPVAALVLSAKAPSYVWVLPASMRPAAQVIYTCTLTGDGETPALADLTLPMSSFQATMRDGDPSYLACVIPNAVGYVDAIQARMNGDIVVRKGYRLLDGTVQMEEIARVSFETLQLDQGAHSASASLVGHRTTTSSAVKEVTVVGGLSFSSLQANAKRRIRATLDTFLRVGDTCIFGTDAADRFIVGSIYYAIDTTQAIMEVTEA